jgi:hypothetical protein
MRPEHLSGLEDLARVFTKMCIESPMGYADVYVRCSAAAYGLLWNLTTL